jgi:hypothetical protein
MTDWKEIRHQVQHRIRNTVSRNSGKGKGEGKSKRKSKKKEITPVEAIVLIASIVIIIMALGGIGLVYNVFAQLV